MRQRSGGGGYLVEEEDAEGASCRLRVSAPPTIANLADLQCEQEVTRAKLLEACGTNMNITFMHRKINI